MSRAAAGREHGRALITRLVSELRSTRTSLGISQRQVADSLGWSQPQVSRLERLVQRDRISAVDIAMYGAVLGARLAASLHPTGDAVRDAGHQALIRRLTDQLAPAWRIAREVPLPLAGDRRSWDLLLRLGAHLVGAEAETRIRDVQHLVRHLRERQRDGGTDIVILVLSDSAFNRRVLSQLLEALGPEFATSPRRILRALRDGQPLPGSGVVLV